VAPHDDELDQDAASALPLRWRRLHLGKLHAIESSCPLRRVSSLETCYYSSESLRCVACLATYVKFLADNISIPIPIHIYTYGIYIYIHIWGER
jgi:hypothetical protein